MKPTALSGTWRSSAPRISSFRRLTRISAETFRAIAPAVSDGVLHHRGERIPLDAGNSYRVAAAIADMRSALPKKSITASEVAQEIQDISREPDLDLRIHNLASRCIAIVAELDRIARQERLRISRTVWKQELGRVREEILRVAA